MEYPKDLDEAQHEAAMNMLAKICDVNTVDKFKQLFQDAEAATHNLPLYYDTQHNSTSPSPTPPSSPISPTSSSLLTSSGKIRFANLRAHLRTSSGSNFDTVGSEEEDAGSSGGGGTSVSVVGSVAGGGSGGGGGGGGSGGGSPSGSGSESEEPGLYVYNSKTKKLERASKSPLTSKIIRNIKPAW